MDERYFLSADTDRNIYIWDINYSLTNPVVESFSVHEIADLKFIPKQNSMIFGVDHHGVFNIWDIKEVSGGKNSLSIVGSKKAHHSKILKFDFSDENPNIFFTTDGNELALWDIRNLDR